MIEKRLFIVTNRLPVYFTDSGTAKCTAGGLAASIQHFLQEQVNDGNYGFKEIYWAGVAGCSAESWTRASYNMESACYKFIAVHVNAKMYHSYYHAIANTVIWPLFHYFPSYAEYDFKAYEQYTKVNEVFAETLLKHLRVTDVVWIHDYHLLPLAGLLRKAMPGLTIGFFLHIPFPSYEIFRLMPKRWQQQLVTGMLGADLSGFQTIDYATHFLETVRMMLEIDNELHTIRYNNRLIKVDVFPVGIAFKRFSDAYDRPEVVQVRQSFRKSFGTRKIIFSIGRLNYTKGIFNRIKAYEHFLTTYPEFQNQVVFVLVIIPSNDDHGKYIEQKKMIDEAISNINSTIGHLNWQPVTYQHNALSFNSAMGLYTASDVAMITPLRDGMNLISKEFVASRKDQRGVLVLSELAGAARELTGAVLVNPNDFQETAEQLKSAVEMGEEEQESRMKLMQKRLSEYDVHAWVADFLMQLRETKNVQQAFQIKYFNDYSRRAVLEQYQQSQKRLILLDYDGTLVPFATKPEHATAGKHLMSILEKVSGCAENDVVIISGRNSEWLDDQLGALPLSLVAEHGAKIKWKGDIWRAQHSQSEDWKAAAHKIMTNYTRRCAQTFIEEKEFSIVWHFRNAIQEEGKIRSLELYAELNQYLSYLNLQVIMDNKAVEVRPFGIGRDKAIMKIVSDHDYDFILAMGDDRADEDLFKILGDIEYCYSIKIGPEASYAKYNLLTQQMAISFLEHLAALTEASV